MMSDVTHARHGALRSMSRRIATFAMLSALMLTGLVAVVEPSATAATSNVVSSMTLDLSNGATYVAASSPYTGPGTGSAWTLTVPQDSAAASARANFAIGSIVVVMPQADVTTSPVAVVRLTTPGSAVPYGTLTYSGSQSAWTLTPASTQTLRTAGTQVLQMPVVDTAGVTTVVQLSLVVAPLVSSVQLHTNDGVVDAATASPYTGAGNGSAWVVTVHPDPGATNATMNAIDVVMPLAKVTTSPITVVDIVSAGRAVAYGTMIHASGATWVLTPSSTQSLQTAGTWVLQAPVSDVGGTTSTLQVTLVVDPRPILFTGPATDVTTSGATVNGSVTNLGSDAVASVRLCLSTTVAGAQQCGASFATVKTSSSSTTTSYRATMYGLKAGTLYFVVLEASDATTGIRIRGQVQEMRTSVTLVLTSTHGYLGTPLVLTSSGGMGAGGVGYVVSNQGSARCTINFGRLNAARVGTCVVTVTQAGDATYLAARSAPTTVTFGPARRTAQATLALTSTTGIAGTALALSSRGGSGVGAVTYDVVNPGTAGCWITGVRLNATRIGTCVVTVTKAGDATYLASSSLATTVTFTAAQVTFAARRVVGSVRVGQISTVRILGSGFYGKPIVRSNEVGTRAVVIHDHGNELVVRVQLRPRSLRGWHTFTVVLANGRARRVRYLVTAAPVKLRASGVNGFAIVGRTVNVTIEGAGFYGKPIVRSNEAGTRAVAVHDRGNELVVRVQTRGGSPRGWHTFTIVLSNGHLCRVRYSVR